MQPIYERVQREHPTVRVVAIHDNLTIVGPAVAVFAAADLFADRAGKLGLVVGCPYFQAEGHGFETITVPDQKEDFGPPSGAAIGPEAQRGGAFTPARCLAPA